MIPDSEGAGHLRGGCGMVRELQCLVDQTKVTMGADRRRFTPWGIDNSHRARGQHCYVIKADGSKTLIPTKVFIHLNQGDRLRIETPGGGGWGDPRQRDRQRVRHDVEEGLISPRRATEVYGA